MALGPVEIIIIAVVVLALIALLVALSRRGSGRSS